MGGYIPEEILESIRLRADIVQVISAYVNLQKKGKNFTGPCPFHQESEPSFTVTPEKQIFYCFGCNQGGNVFKFIMLQHNVTFPEAVKMLGEKVGVPVPDGYSPVMRERLRQEEKAWKINALARDYFNQALLRHPEAEAARKYLANRGVDSETVKEFGLGYALQRWDDLINFMRTRGFGERDLVNVGLAVSGDRKAYDRFRARLMFPISDARGRVVGYGGRVLGEGVPKYLNTSETDFFNKGKILYGLDRARQHIVETGFAIITEGYMDTIAAHQFGVKNTVASLGTSLTKEHGSLLSKYSREIIIAYDADAAGVAATIRGLDLLQELGCRVRVLTLPEGKDPDEFLRARGIDEWRHQVENATPLIEFKLKQAMDKYKHVSASKEAVLEEILPNLAAIGNELEKNEAIKMVAARLYTSFHAVGEELQRFSNNIRKKRTNPDKIVKNKHNINRKNRIDFGTKAEVGLLKLMLEDTAVIDTVINELSGNFFQDTFCYKVFERLQDMYKQPSYTPAVLFDYLEDEYQQELGNLLMEPVPIDNMEETLLGFMLAIKRRQLLEQRDKLLVALADAEKAGNRDEVDRLLREISITEKP